MPQLRAETLSIRATICAILIRRDQEQRPGRVTPRCCRSYGRVALAPRTTDEIFAEAVEIAKARGTLS